MSSAPHPTGRNTMSSPHAASMSSAEKTALLQSKDTLTITWTDKGTSKTVTIENVPKVVFLTFCPQARRHFQTSPRGPATYDFGVQADLAPAAVRYLIGAMLAACKAPGTGGAALPPAFPEPANVLNHLKCLVAVKRLGVVRFVEYAWRNAAMDAVRAAGRVTLGELAYAHVAFGAGGGDAKKEEEEKSEEPVLFRHILNCAVYAELTDEVEHPETLAINRYAYGGHPALAVMKKAVEVEVEKKLVERREKEEVKEQKARERRDFLERKAKRGLAEKKKQDRLEQARNGERALNDGEVKAMHMAKYAGPQAATVSHRLR